MRVINLNRLTLDRAGWQQSDAAGRRIWSPGPAVCIRFGLTRNRFNLPLRAQRGNLVAVVMVICRRVFNLNEIATSLRSSQ